MKPLSIKKILIANRGEIAIRIIRTCKKMGISTVGLYQADEPHALHCKFMDQLFLLKQNNNKSGYLDIEQIIQIALSAEVDAIHPGYGYLSENSVFANEVNKAGLIFIGPDANAIALMGDKMKARKAAIQAGVPVVPGLHLTEGTITDRELTHLADIGYPLLIKAAFGGGGKGMRLVQNEKELQTAILAAKREATSAFGKSEVFIEKWIDQSRHIEIQILADKHGQYFHFFERNCSIQRRHQKIIEETPSPSLPRSIVSAMTEAALQLAKKVQYYNAGTIEFIVDDLNNFYFLEMNTRLQVEHPITEMITNIDLVELQLRVASGERLSLNQTDIVQSGHSIELRIYAEDIFKNFLPSAGLVQWYQPPNIPSIRVDSSINESSMVSINYDPMLTKLIIHHKDRASALDLCAHALNQFIIWGTETNLQLLKTIITHPTFQSGDYNTNFINLYMPELLQRTISQFSEPNPLLIALAALLAGEKQLTLSHSLSKTTFETSLPSISIFSKENKYTCFFNLDSIQNEPNKNYIKEIMLSLLADITNSQKSNPSKMNIIEAEILVQKIDPPFSIQLIHLSFNTEDLKKSFSEPVFFKQIADKIIFHTKGNFHIFYKDWPARKSSYHSSLGRIISPMPGKVLRIPVNIGDQVMVGDSLITLEAMKMENDIRSSLAAVIKKIHVQIGDTVSNETLLMELENNLDLS